MYEPHSTFDDDTELPRLNVLFLLLLGLETSPHGTPTSGRSTIAENYQGLLPSSTPRKVSPRKVELRGAVVLVFGRDVESRGDLHLGGGRRSSCCHGWRPHRQRSVMAAQTNGLIR